MAKTNTTEKGIRDNLYGIPLDNIYTPEEISDLEKARVERITKSRRRRARKQREKKRFAPPTRKQAFIGVAILSALILLMLIKTPLIVRLNPRLYVSNTIEDTVKSMANERARITKSLFGFDLFTAPDVSAEFAADITADSKGLATGVSVKGNGQIMSKFKEASLTTEFADGDNPFFTMSAYLNEDEAGFNIRELFGEYWTVNTKDYGAKWNNSGFRKALYKDTVSDTADISYSTIFPMSEILTDKSIKSISKQADRLFSASYGKYLGKEEYTLNGKTVRGKTFRFGFDGEDLKKRIPAILDIALTDEIMVKKSDTVCRELFKDMSELSRRISDDIVFSDVYAIIGEHDGKIISARLVAVYTNNMLPAALEMRFNIGDTDNVCNAVFVSADIRDGSRETYVSLSTKGNHAMDKKSFTDRTVLTISKGGNLSEWSVESSIDLKSGDTVAVLGKSVNGVSSSAEFSGTYKKQGGAGFDFTSINISACEPTGVRLLSATGKITFGRGVLLGRHSPSGKRYILDMDKTDVETYIIKIEETDRYKFAKEKLEGIFGE